MKFTITSLYGNKSSDLFFDKKDVMLFFNYRWYLHRPNPRCFYAATRHSNGKFLYMHHLILPPKKNLVVDHINRNSLDNRRKNLRYATFSANLMNSPPRNGKKYKGVYFCKRGKTPLKKPWCVRLNTKHGGVHGGYHPTEKAAAIAYNKLAWEYFRDYSWLNKIDGWNE